MAGPGVGSMKIAAVLAKAVGLDPVNVLSVHLALSADDIAVLSFKVVCADEAGKVIIEDDDIKTEIRTWTEGRFKRFAPIFNDARDSALPTLYERVDGDA